MKPFTLENDTPAPKRYEPVETAARRQGMLFAGLDCLPGQLDLFETDGQAEHVETNR